MLANAEFCNKVWKHLNHRDEFCVVANVFFCKVLLFFRSLPPPGALKRNVSHLGLSKLVGYAGTTRSIFLFEL